MIEKILFFLFLVTAIIVFARKIKTIRKGILSGQKKEINDHPEIRLKNLVLIAFGQKKMFRRPVHATLHAFIYIGFLVINLEVLEIVIDGLSGSHRILSFAGPLYDGLMATNELLGLLVVIACIYLLIRRNFWVLGRFKGNEIGVPQRRDANLILIIELALMAGLFLFNAADIAIHATESEAMAGLFPVSMYLAPYLGSETELLNLFRSSGWWFHIVGIFLFLNYLPYSKHFHIIMAFPNTWYSKLTPAGKLNSPESITREIHTILNPSMNVETVGNEPVLLGAKDTNELSWKQLLDSYSCTECGRCTSSCPANLTGKKLSPRKIVMSVRDRIEDLEKNKESEKTLLNHFISAEELWACTTCNACVTECPVSIDPVSTIIELRRHMVMEQSSAPTSLNNMFTNIENNGSPWAFSAMDRFNWASDITISA